MATKRESKHLMERRRRARINESLSHLKLLVVGEVKRKHIRLSKMDKADVLEMAVEYVKKTREQSAEASTSTASSSAPAEVTVDRYRAGFNACADVLQSQLEQMPQVSNDCRARMLDHLANFIQNKQWFARHLKNANQPLQFCAANLNELVQLQQLPDNSSRSSSSCGIIAYGRPPFDDGSATQGTIRGPCTAITARHTTVRDEGGQEEPMDLSKSKPHTLTTYAAPTPRSEQLPPDGLCKRFITARTPSIEGQQCPTGIMMGSTACRPTGNNNNTNRTIPRKCDNKQVSRNHSELMYGTPNDGNTSINIRPGVCHSDDDKENNGNMSYYRINKSNDVAVPIIVHTDDPMWRPW